MLTAWALVAIILLAATLAQRNLLSPTAIFLGYSTLVFPITFLVSSGLSSPSVFFLSVNDIPDSNLWSAFWLFLIGIVAFAVTRFALPIPLLRWPQVEIAGGRLKWLLLVCLLLAAVGAMQLIDRFGGVSQILQNLGRVRSGELTGLGLQTYAVTMLLPTALQFALMAAIQTKSPYTRWIFAATLAASLMGGLLGFRGPFIALLVQALLIWQLMRGGIRKKTMIVIMALAVPLVTLSGVVRALADTRFIQRVEDGDPALVAAAAVDFAVTRVRGVETTVLMQRYVDTHEYAYFLPNIRESFLSVVPSSVVDKGQALSELIATDVYGGDLVAAGIIRDVYGGVAYTYIAEGYWNLGIAGILLFCAGLGAGLRVLETADVRAPISLSQLIVYKAVAGFMMMMVEAPQLAVNAMIANIVINALMLALLDKRFALVWDAVKGARGQA